MFRRCDEAFVFQRFAAGASIITISYMNIRNGYKQRLFLSITDSLGRRRPIDSFESKEIANRPCPDLE